MRTEFITESEAADLVISDDEAAQLNSLGRALASQKTWFSAGDDESNPTKPKTVIRCKRVSGGNYKVRVSEAVGVVGVGDTQLIVLPKIPLSHLLHLLAESEQVPRLLYERSRLCADDTFFTVIARWFVQSCEDLLRQGLMSDYGRVTADLTCVRGRIHPVKTYRSLLAGRAVIRCDFERFGEDTALNRVLKAAALKLLGLPSLPADLAARCRRLTYRMSDISDLRASDIDSKPDAPSRRYRQVHPLALAVLRSTGMNMASGNGSTWTFLFRTPEPVEKGIRKSLERFLEPHRPVRSSKLYLPGERIGEVSRDTTENPEDVNAQFGKRSRSLNPDLVFGANEAVGDVKYRRNTKGEIKRSELNQVTTFATGYESGRGLVIAFSKLERGESIQVGKVQVRNFNWNYEIPDPEEASRRLANHISKWLDG